jgi:sugar diacid utilization regulator
MPIKSRATRPASIIPAAARELLDTLTSRLEIPFTLTDDKGAIIASTGGRARGQIDVNALTVLQHGSPMEVTGESVLRWHLEGAESPSVSMEGGAFTTGAAVYLPLRIGDTGSVLIAHGEPDRVGLPARTAAPAVELAMEFARAAALTVRQGVGPDLALYRLLRGSPAEAHEAQLIAKVAGWDLRVPRIAIVAIPTSKNGDRPNGTGARAFSAILDALGDRAPHTPFGRLRGSEWVVLPEVEPPDGPRALRGLANELRQALSRNGAAVSVGLGELHEPAPPVLSLRRSYREALHSARCGARLRRDDAVHDLGSLGTVGFLAPSGSSRTRLAARILEPLHDQQELLQSLRAFLTGNLSLAAAASHVGVHRHTVRNHLERIHDLTGLDPRALDDAVQFRLALLIGGRNGRG